jgi:hypothetical protein
MRTFQLHSLQKQVILGTLLGTSCCRKHPRGKNHSLYMRATDDLNWFRVKCGHLGEYARDPYSESLTWESCSHSMWNDFRDLCYTDGRKKANMEWLDTLSDLGLSVWFLDKGGICGNKAYIRVANLEDHEIIQRWFNEVNYPCQIKKKIAVFDPETSKRLLKAITPCFPKYLLDKTDRYRVRKYL